MLTMPTSLAVLAAIFLFPLLTRAQVSVNVPTLSANSSLQGNLLPNETDPPIFLDLTLLDPPYKTPTAQQHIYRFTLEQPQTRIRVSTCFGTTFSTHLLLFDAAPSLSSTPIGESANDLSCPNLSRAALHATLPPSTYYLMLTGTPTTSSTSYNVTLTFLPLPPAYPPWHLDRIDQHSLPLDSRYTIKPPTKNPTIYLIYTGVNPNHLQLQGRILQGYDFVQNSENNTIDCTGQGTHIAAIIAGNDFGVIPNANIIPLRVFDCKNVATIANIADAIHWALIHSLRNNLREMSVIAMMFSLPLSISRALQPAINHLQSQGVPAVAPAGNHASDACSYFPAAIPAVLSVGATDRTDARAQFSNSGPCVNVYAPGVDIASAWHTAQNASQILSGTEQAAAIATGAVALLVSLNEGISNTKVNNIMSSVSTKNMVTNVPQNDSASLTYVRSIPDDALRNPAEEGFVLINAIIRSSLTSCAAGGVEIGAFRTVFAQRAGVQPHDVDATCRTEGVNRRLKRTLYNAGMVRQEDSEKDVNVQTRVSERKAAVAFAAVERALDEGVVETREDLGFDFSVVESPWAVDSGGVIYWGAPTFPKLRRSGLSAGAIVAVVFGLVFVGCSVGMGVWIWRRHVQKVDEIVSMQGSADFERGPVKFDDFKDGDDGPRGSRSFRSLKKVMSFRRGESTHEGISGTGGGLNRMSSYVGMVGPEPVGKDLVRLKSYGGEAFAGMTALEADDSRSEDGNEGEGDQDQDGEQGAKSWRRMNSVRGRQPDIALLRLNTNIGAFGAEEDGLEEDMVAEMEMKSIGGEAFAMLTHMPSVAEIRAQRAAQEAEKNPNNSEPGPSDAQ